MSDTEQTSDVEEAQRRRWARFGDIQRRLHEIQGEIMTHGVPTHGQAQGICDALQAIIDSIPRERGYPIRVDIQVRYHR